MNKATSSVRSSTLFGFGLNLGSTRSLIHYSSRSLLNNCFASGTTLALGAEVHKDVVALSSGRQIAWPPVTCAQVGGGGVPRGLARWQCRTHSAVGRPWGVQRGGLLEGAWVGLVRNRFFVSFQLPPPPPLLFFHDGKIHTT